MKNLTITDAAGIENNGQIWHRAITTEGNLNIINCTFDSNKAGEQYQYDNVDDFAGSVIYQTNGNLNIQNSNFIDNVVHNYGIIFSTGTVTANNSYFYNNKAIHRENSAGGVIYALLVDVIENCTFKSNTAVENGGSIAIFSGNTKIINSTFEGTSQQSTINGGAIMTFGTIDLIENSTFANFSSTGSGGAIYIWNDYSNTLIKNSTFKNIVTQGDGGAIYTDGKVELDNVTLSDNRGFSWSTTYKGGAIYAGGDVLVENSTIINNFASEGAAIYSNGAMTINNCEEIFNNGIDSYGNTASKGGAFYAKGDVNIDETTFGANYATNGGVIYSESNVNFYNSLANGSGMGRRNANGSFIYALGSVDVENSTVDSFIMTTAGSGVIYNRGNIIVRNSTLTKCELGMGDASSIGGAIHTLGNGEVYNSNFTYNNAKKYSSLYVGGTLDIYDSYFYNNTHGCAFGEGRTIVNNTNFTNNTGGAELYGRVVGTNSTLNLTNSNIVGTNGTSGVFRGLYTQKTMPLLKIVHFITTMHSVHLPQVWLFAAIQTSQLKTVILMRTDFPVRTVTVEIYMPVRMQPSKIVISQIVLFIMEWERHMVL